MYAARLETPPANAGVSPLPPRLLRRVLERMQADLHANLDLAALAAESGYSRAHFLRTFRAATGQTPHWTRGRMRLHAHAQTGALKHGFLLNIGWTYGAKRCKSNAEELG